MKNKALVLIVGLLMLCSIANAQNIGGIGAMLAIDSSDGYRLPIIKSLMPNSPAAASMKENQFILKVNEVSCRDKTIEEVVGLIRGEAGTHVKLSVADNKPGKHATTYDLVRAVIQQPAAPNQPAADPVEVFNANCEHEIKQLKRQGYAVIKTFTSDCGNYFFNFNADTGLHHVTVYTLEDKGNAGGITASIFDNQHEADAVKLKKETASQKGDIYFKRTGVGGIKIELAGGGICKSIYIVVYK
ncbi:MAG: carboxyl-terminal protease [Flavipsychrobacter sp.]|nr:carboxyl-terminal protease [Flavipsychrobacter sp.]